MRKTFIETTKENTVYFVAMLGLWITYGTLSVMAPAARAVNRYGLSLIQTNILRLTILVPYLFIWMIGLYAVLRFRKYSKLIASSSESRGFRQIAWGIVMLLVVVVVPPMIGLISAYNPESPSVVKTATILRNGTTMFFYLSAFYLFWRASMTLKKTLGTEKDKDEQSLSMLLAVPVILSIPYVWFVFHNPFRTVSDDALVRPTYYLPDSSILLTIVVPYILMWFLGILTIMNIKQLASTVKGVVYRKSLVITARGLVVVISSVILLQFMSQATTFFKDLGLQALLVIIYLLLGFIAAGYVYLARGARELAAIEEA